MIISKTPFRFSIFGGGCDYPGWFNKNDSLVLTSAMDYYCFIMVRKLGKFFLEYKSRASYSQIETVFNNKDFEHPSIRECLNFLDFENERISITHAGDLPARSGIGSSSSFTVGLLKAVKGIKNENISGKNLAKLACYVEQNLIDEHVGVQDQYAASLGGIIELNLKKNKVIANKLNISKEFIKYFEKHILLGFTGTNRNSNVYAEKISKNINENKIDDYLFEINDIAIEGTDLFKNESDISVIAKLLAESWKLKINLDIKSTYGIFDDIIKTAISSGAVAGKLMGAGGGGFFYLVAEPKYHEKIKNKLKKIKIWVPFKFSKKGCTIIHKHNLDEDL